MPEIRHWKKVYEFDLANIISEFRDAIKTPSVIILTGDLGAGKTTFTKYFTDIQKVTSPTYALIQELGRSAHADFYRLEGPDEIMHLEIPLYLEEKDYFLVEWGKDHLAALDREVPDNFLFYELKIEINPDSPTDNGAPSRNYLLNTISRN